MTNLDTSEMVIEGYEIQDTRQPCPDCGQLTSPRGMTRHRNSAHGAGITSQATSAGGTAKRRTRKSKTVSSDVQDGLSSLAAKLVFGITLFYAWWGLRQANIHDPDGSISDQMAMSDDEAAAIGRVLSRMFVNTDSGKRLAPVIVENEDLIDAGFAAFEWYKRNRQLWDELESRGYVPPAQASRSNGKVNRNNGANGPTEPDRQEGEGPGYIPPNPIDFLGE